MTTAGKPVAVKTPVLPKEQRTPARVVLQRRAPKIIRRHFLRGTLRVAALVAGDVATFAALQAGLWALRDGEVLGSGLGGFLRSVVSGGYLGGWQFGVALVVGLLVAGTYRQGDHRRDPKRIFTGVALATALALWHSLWLRGLPSVLLHYVAVVGAVGTAILASRFLIDKLVGRLNGWVRPAERVLFVGDPNHPDSANVCGRLLRSERMQLAGWVSSNWRGGVAANGNGASAVHANGNGNGNGASPHHGAPLETAADFWKVLHTTNADTVVLCGDLLDDHMFEIIVEASAAAGCRLLAVSRYEGIGRLKPSVVWHHQMLFVELAAPSVRAYQMVVKRAIDVMGAWAGLVLFASVFALVALAIKLDSPGPVFYRSSRWGRFGRQIGIWKFRTMIDGAADMLDQDGQLKSRYDANIKLVEDPRVTRVGRWLRRWSLDELPQLYNVLKGDMSLVGPRPKLIGEEEKYGTALERVLAVRPGLTGLWQISGRNNTTYEERIALDERYVAHASLGWDIEILLRTVPVVLSGNGAH